MLRKTNATAGSPWESPRFNEAGAAMLRKTAARSPRRVTFGSSFNEAGAAMLRKTQQYLDYVRSISELQ